MHCLLTIPVLTFSSAVSACEMDQTQYGCRIDNGACTCAYGCRSEFRYKTKKECQDALKVSLRLLIYQKTITDNPIQLNPSRAVRVTCASQIPVNTEAAHRFHKCLATSAAARDQDSTATVVNCVVQPHMNESKCTQSNASLSEGTI